MARAEPQVNIRIPAELKGLLESMASDNGRSLTAEIISRLQQSFEARAEAVQLEIVNEALKAQLESYRRLVQITDVMQKVLAGTLVRVIDKLPDDLREQYAGTRALADAIDRNDPRGIGVGFLTIFQDDPKTVGEIHKFMAELEPAIAAKERGEKKAGAKTQAIKKKP